MVLRLLPKLLADVGLLAVIYHEFKTIAVGVLLWATCG